MESYRLSLSSLFETMRNKYTVNILVDLWEETQHDTVSNRGRATSHRPVLENTAAAESKNKQRRVSSLTLCVW